jgi:hypothetical protein
MDKAMHSIFVQDGQMGTGMSGEGIFDVARGLTKLGSKILDTATGPLGTAISNAMPSSDATARPGFAGEKHAILKLPNGKFGRANYMGPGTHVSQRLRRRDPPRTMSDKVAQAHDIRYGLARNQKQVHRADKRMVKKLKDIERRGQDSRLNTQPGMRMIQAKMLAEKSGLVKPGRIASFGDAPKGDQRMFQQKLRQLEQEGFGLPGDLLKERLLTSMTRKKRVVGAKKRARGSGLGLPGAGISVPGGGIDVHRLIGHLSRTLQATAFPHLLRSFAVGPVRTVRGRRVRGRGLKLAGQGVPKMKLRKLLNQRMLKAFNDGASRDGRAVVGRGKKLKKLGAFLKKLKPMASAAAKVLLPVVIKLIEAKLKGQPGGRGPEAFADFQHRMNNPGVFAKLSGKLSSALFEVLKRAIQGKTGKGLCGGESFWSGFKRGFMSVINPALKVAKAVAPIVPLLL